MMHRSLFPRDMFADLDLLTRDMRQAFESTPSIRNRGRGGYPALNVGSTPEAVEIDAFAPGLDTKKLDVQLDRGVLTLSGERPATVGAPAGDEGQTTLHVNERFAGRFHRVISLPDDIDPNGVTADYRDGVLHVRVKRSEATQPRRIEIH